MKSDPAASLRWRSRLSKEAVHQDDSSLAAMEGGRPVMEEDYGLATEKSKNGTFRSTMASFFWSRFWTLLAVASSGCAIYVLEVDLSWYTAVASSLNIFLSAVLVYAVRRIRRLGTVRQHVNYAKQRVQSLATQNERLYRQLHHLDGMQNRLESVQHDLTKLLGKNDPTRMVTAVQRWRVVQQELNALLTQQVQHEIICAVLETDRDANFELSAPELERLIVRLQVMPGIELNETALRRQLEREDDRSLQAILRLIRRIIEDARNSAEEEHQQQPHGERSIMASSNKSSAIVTFNAAALCQAERRKAGEGDLIQF